MGIDDQTPRASLVRPYLLTGGRVVSPGDLSLETQVVAAAVGPSGRLRFEQRAIADAAFIPLSVAEIAARLRLQVAVVRVLVSEMAAAGQLTVFGTSSTATDLATLRRVIHGLHQLA